MLHESLYGYYPPATTTADATNTGNGDLNPNQQQSHQNTAIRPTANNLDTDLALALRISEQEQQILQEELKREQEMLEEVLRLSLQEK